MQMQKKRGTDIFRGLRNWRNFRCIRGKNASETNSTWNQLFYPGVSLLNLNTEKNEKLYYEIRTEMADWSNFGWWSCFNNFKIFTNKDTLINPVFQKWLFYAKIFHWNFYIAVSGPINLGTSNFWYFSALSKIQSINSWKPKNKKTCDWLVIFNYIIIK